MDDDTWEFINDHVKNTKDIHSREVAKYYAKNMFLDKIKKYLDPEMELLKDQIWEPVEIGIEFASGIITGLVGSVPFGGGIFAGLVSWTLSKIGTIMHNFYSEFFEDKIETYVSDTIGDKFAELLFKDVDMNQHAIQPSKDELKAMTSQIQAE